MKIPVQAPGIGPGCHVEAWILIHHEKSAGNESTCIARTCERLHRKQSTLYPRYNSVAIA